MNWLTVVKASIITCMILVVSKHLILTHHNQTDQSDVIPESPTYTICTYFVTIGNSEDQDKDNREMLDIWKESWEKQGWNTKILTEKDAEMHPHYNETTAALSNLPSVYSRGFARACYLRWVAAVASDCTVRTQMLERLACFVWNALLA
jgi:hypothetical protein